MKIKSQNFEILTEYPEFKLGSDTDCDILARMCGIEDGESVAQADAIIEKDGKEYKVSFYLKSTGDQKGIKFNNKETQKNLDVLAKANNRELISATDIKNMAKQIKLGNLNYDFNCWYEAEIEIFDENKESIFCDYESNIGLDGVWESIQAFKTAFEDIQALVENIEYIFESFDDN